MVDKIWPYLLSFLALLSYGSLPVLAKYISVTMPPFLFIGIVSLVVSAIAFVIFSFQYVPAAQSAGFIAILPKLIGFGILNIIAFWSFLAATRALPVTQYQLFMILTPLVGGILGYLLLNEPMKIQYLIAFAFIAVGLIICIRT